MSKFWTSWKKEILIGFGILVLAAFVRIYNLTLLPVFGDEAIYIRWAQVMRAEPTLRFLPLSDGKQPLFMWVIIPFTKVFSDPLFAGRFVSVVTGLGTLVGIFVLTQTLFQSKKVALIAGLIYAISPFSVFFDRLALADSMLSFFGVWTFIFSLITAKKMRLDTAMLAGFFLGGALLTKSPAIFFALLIPLTLLFHDWPKKAKEKFNRVSVFVFLFTSTYAIAYGMYNILRLGPNFNMIAVRNKDYVYPLVQIFQSPFDPLFPFLDRILEYFWFMGPSVLILLFILGTNSSLKQKVSEAVILLIWALVPIFATSEYSRTMTARYIFFSVPYIFISASLAFLTKSESLRKLSTIFLIVFVVHSLVVDLKLLTNPERANLPRSERSGYLEEWTSGYGIKEVADLIREKYLENPNQKIVVGTEGYFGTLPDGLQMYLNDLREVTVIGVGVTVEDVPTSLTDSEKAGNSTYLVVNSTRLMTDMQEAGLNLLAAYPKAVRPDGSRETLLFFELNRVAETSVPTK